MYLLIAFIVFQTVQRGTFSIVAMDPVTREWGVAVASKVFDAGYVVPWIEPEVGAVASQALSNPYLGPWALELLAEGRTADQTLISVLGRDTVPEERQIGIVDRDGHAAAHTGTNTLAWAGHKTGKYFSVQGNILTGPEVVDSMVAVFERTQGLFAERLLAALEAGETVGGDKRGKQSAALYVRRKRGGYLGVDDRLVDIKVLDHPEPVAELRRLYDMWQYMFLVPAYLRIADEEPENNEVFLEKMHILLVKALQDSLDDAEVYNSLAWECAIRQRYPGEALSAAARAHELAPDDANVMDTLAEVYYIIGINDKAIYWEKEALKHEPENEFFKQQLKKFQNAP
jgi:uncharacterized Ntn-hydrolase superfamily protein